MSFHNFLIKKKVSTIWEDEHWNLFLSYSISKFSHLKLWITQLSIIFSLRIFIFILEKTFLFRFFSTNAKGPKSLDPHSLILGPPVPIPTETEPSRNLCLTSHLLARSPLFFLLCFSLLARIHSLCIQVLVRFFLVAVCWDMVFIFLVMLIDCKLKSNFFLIFFDLYELWTCKVCYLTNLRKMVSLFLPWNLKFMGILYKLGSIWNWVMVVLWKLWFWID